MSDRIMVMNEGKIMQIGTPDELVSSPANDFVKRFVIDNLKEKATVYKKFCGECND